MSSPAGTDMAGSGRRAGRRKRRPVLAAMLAIVAIGGLVAAGVGISRQVMPRTFTPAQRRQIKKK